MTTPGAVGMIGLGNMGSALAANLVGAGFTVVAHDQAGPDQAPEGARFVDSVGEVARSCDVVVLSLPDGEASAAVAGEIAAVAPSDRRTTHVVDTSTIGVRAATLVATNLDAADVAYVDAPVSGGPAGARARTLTVMVAGRDAARTHVEGVLAGLSDRRFPVGDRAGMAQALKLANNFLSATALAATSEAIAFGQSVGLDMDTMLTVLNESSGRSSATDDKFPNHVLAGRYASGFANTLMAKDLRLYLDARQDQGGLGQVGLVTATIWARFAAAEPGADFTRIYPFVAGDGAAG